MNAKTFYWDFFGPTAEGTARHFRIHMDEFLAREKLEGCQTGVETAGGNHYAAWCLAPEPVQEAIQKALRPKRVKAAKGD